MELRRVGGQHSQRTLGALAALLSPPAHGVARRLRAPLVAAWMICSSAAVAAETDDVWLGSAPAMPDWLAISGSYRSRAEYLNNTFRPEDPGTDLVHVSRLLLKAELNVGPWTAALELLDARMWGEGENTPIGSDDVNVTEPLQAYVGWQASSFWRNDDHFEVKVGRFTMDLGSRRLVARNQFRNTPNAFTGAQVRWTNPRAMSFDAFYTWPQSRYPNELDGRALRDNDFAFDEERAAVRFWGAHASGLRFFESYRMDFYVLGIEERDQPRAPSRNRDLLTIGYDLSRRWRSFDINVEAAYQFGTSRTTIAASDVRDRKHRAWFTQGRVSRSFEGRLAPTIALTYDYASGDQDPFDSRKEQFDTLYGARRGDLGPSGIFGLLVRGNLLSPSATLAITPFQRTRLRMNYRAAWLANGEDRLLSAGISDPSGRSSDFLGQLFEAQLQWNTWSGKLLLDTGAVYFAKGKYFEQVPAPVDGDDTTYLYFQATLAF